MAHVVDCFDGYVARKCKQTSEIGKWLDRIVDSLKIGVLVHGCLRYYLRVDKLHSLRYSMFVAALWFYIANEPTDMLKHVYDNCLLDQVMVIAMLS